MKDSEIDILIARIESLPDRDIVNALAMPGDYSPEAMIIYDAEAKRRGIQDEIVRPVAQKAAQSRKDKMASSWSIKGIGEKLYGKRSFRADGSYQTTKWFVLFHLPIYPIASFRVRPLEKGHVSVVDILPVDGRQVLDTYCFVALSWIGLAMGFRLVEQSGLPFRAAISAALFGLPVGFLFFVRRRDRRRATE